MQKDLLMGSFKKTIIIIIGIALIAFIMGFILGVDLTINKVADVASRFVNIDRDLIYKAITQYRDTISGCYPSKFNASNYTNSG